MSVAVSLHRAYPASNGKLKATVTSFPAYVNAHDRLITL